MLEQISFDKKDKLERLIQLYLHDLSKDFKIDIDNETCLYQYGDITRYLTGNTSKAFFVKDNELIVGFILYDFYENKNIIQEIFILNNYKKSGYAKKAVIELFDMINGDWEIKAVPNSTRAEAFWTSIISEYTSNNYTLEHTGKYNRAEYTFKN